ncbi:MAG: diacylglycerol kinase family protein [Clostridia bacterium]|nr:diacylglycerol kinase family protein [Clostridia bacterium]
MSKIYVLYNPHSGHNTGKQKAEALNAQYDTALTYVDMTTITDYRTFAAALGAEDKLIICGGDGTLNRFVNEIYDLGIENDILYYATGSGNDFLRDFGKSAGSAPMRINDEIKNLPVVTVNGKSYRFINGIGYGLDGYCCEVGDALRLSSEKPVSYTAIAIKGLLSKYKPTNATVTVDGVTREYKKVWIAPTMVGRYYGGGLMPTPGQRREDRTDHVSVGVMHHAGRLHTLLVFPSVSKGGHIKHKSLAAEFQGRRIKVAFDRPVALQIDGETVLGVTEYEVTVDPALLSQEPAAELLLSGKA